MKICNQEMALFSFTIPDYIFSDLPTYKLSLYVPSADTTHMDSHFSCLVTKNGGFSCSNFQRRSVFDNLALCLINFTAFDPIRFMPLCTVWERLRQSHLFVGNFTRNDRHFGCSIIYTDTFAKCYFCPLTLTTMHDTIDLILLIRTSYLAIISSNEDGFYSYHWVCLNHHNITTEWVHNPIFASNDCVNANALALCEWSFT